MKYDSRLISPKAPSSWEPCETGSCALDGKYRLHIPSYEALCLYLSKTYIRYLYSVLEILPLYVQCPSAVFTVPPFFIKILCGLIWGIRGCQPSYSESKIRSKCKASLGNLVRSYQKYVQVKGLRIQLSGRGALIQHVCRALSLALSEE